MTFLIGSSALLGAATVGCDSAAPPPDAPATIAAALDDRIEPEGPEHTPLDPEDPRFEAAQPDQSDDPFIDFHLDFDPCDRAVRRELESFVDNVRQTYTMAGTSGWSVTAVRTQADGRQCVVEGAGGFARSAYDGYLAYTPDVRQNIASVSKAFAAIALYDAMRNHPDDIQPGDFVADYLPADWDLGPGTDTITFHEVLKHTAGISSTDDDLASIKAWFKFADCDGSPNLWCMYRGTKDYSNAGFVLVQYLFARLAYPDFFDDKVTRFGVGMLGDQYVSGFLFEMHVQQHYLFPHDLAASCMFDKGDDALAYVASANPATGTGKGPVSRADAHPWCGTGGLSARTRDVARFLAHFHNGDLDMGAASAAASTIEDKGYGFDQVVTTPVLQDKHLIKRGLLPMSKDPKRQFKSLAAIQRDTNTTIALHVNDPGNLLDTFMNAWDARALPASGQ